MFHLAAWHQSVDPAGVAVQLTAIADQALTVVTPAIRVPALNNIVGIAGLAESTVAPLMRLVSPVLRRRSNMVIDPLNTGAAAAVEPNTPQAFMDLRQNPVSLPVNDSLTMELTSNPAAAQLQTGLVWLSDKPIEPLRGRILTVRATSAVALTASIWAIVTITFDQDLPRGRYQVVGFRAESAGMVAARLVGVGYQFRPGVIGTDLVSDIEHDAFRYGNFGEFIQFEDIEPPQIECLSVSADATQVFYLDLIQLREDVTA